MDSDDEPSTCELVLAILCVIGGLVFHIVNWRYLKF
jgi:hypothetical protein